MRKFNTLTPTEQNQLLGAFYQEARARFWNQGNPGYYSTTTYRKKSLFWPIIWIFIFTPIGLIWTIYRIFENDSIDKKFQTNQYANPNVGQAYYEFADHYAVKNQIDPENFKQIIIPFHNLFTTGI